MVLYLLFLGIWRCSENGRHKETNWFLCCHSSDRGRRTCHTSLIIITSTVSSYLPQYHSVRHPFNTTLSTVLVASLALLFHNFALLCLSSSSIIFPCSLHLFVCETFESDGIQSHLFVFSRNMRFYLQNAKRCCTPKSSRVSSLSLETISTWINDVILLQQWRHQPWWPMFYVVHVVDKLQIRTWKSLYPCSHCPLKTGRVLISKSLANIICWMAGTYTRWNSNGVNSICLTKPWFFVFLYSIIPNCELVYNSCVTFSWSSFDCIVSFVYIASNQSKHKGFSCLV